MNVFNQSNCTVQLTTASPTFVQLLEEVLVAVGWTSVLRTGSTLTAINTVGKKIVVKDSDNSAILIGYRNIQDTRGFPSIGQMPSNATFQQGISIPRNPLDTNWLLFADSQTFYFLHSQKLFGFSFFEALFDDDETFFVLGASAANTTYQLLSNNTSSLSSVIYLEGDGMGLSLSKQAGASIFYRIDDYDFSHVVNSTLLAASPIAIHHADTKQCRGFIHDLFAFSNTFSSVGQIFSRGGYTLYCVIINGRCYGVRLDA